MQTVKVEFTQRRDEFDTGPLQVSAHVIDTKTDKPVTAGSLKEVGDWLKSNGYRCLVGFGGVWSKSKGKPHKWSIQ